MEAAIAGLLLLIASGAGTLIREQTLVTSRRAEMGLQQCSRRWRNIEVASFMLLSTMLSGHVMAGETMGQAVELALRAYSAQPPTSAPAPTPPQHELAAIPPAQSTATVVSQKPVLAAVLRHRNPELSTQDIVVASVNAAGVETSRTIIRDPRIVRSETADPSGRLNGGTVLYRPDVTFSVTIPDAKAFAVRLYKPRWTGQAFVLDLISEVSLPEHD